LSAAAGARYASEILQIKLCILLGLEYDINPEHHLGQYGIDSLVALEIRNWIKKELGADLAVFEISGEATLQSIGKIVSRKSLLRPKHWKD
jgi:acyl carrier protein